MANEQAHSAMQLLKFAHDIEKDYDANSAQMEAHAVGAAGYIDLVNKNEILARDMFRVCSASITIFQTMMEAVLFEAMRFDRRFKDLNLNESYKTKTSLVLETMGKDTDSFHAYHRDIYMRFRIPMTQSQQGRLGVFNELSTQALHQGFAHGWDTYAKLAAGSGTPLDADSWPVICRAHGLPEIIA